MSAVSAVNFRPKTLQRLSGAGRTYTLLHTCAPAPFGGLEEVIRSLTIEQVERGHTVHVAAVLDHATPDHPMLLDLRANGIEVYPLRLKSRAYRRERQLIGKLCETLRPDVVHTHGYRCDVLHGGVARGMGVPTVTTVHGFTRGGWKNRLYERLQKRAHRSYDAVVAVSRPQLDELSDAGVPESRLHCVPNAWSGTNDFLRREEARDRLAVPPNELCLGFVGRLSAEKGPDVLLRGVARAGVEARAVCVGDGRLRSELEELAMRLGIGDRVRFTGAVAGAAQLIPAFDAVVLSSRTEGTPIVLFEAMAAGVPVIATRVGGVPDVVSGEEALLIPPEDPAALAEAIDTLAADPGAAARRAARARERLRRERGAAPWVEHYDAVYDRCVGQGGEGHR